MANDCTTEWNVADLPHLVTNDPFLPTTPNFRPDKIHVGYGNFLDMSFDINGTNDSNTVFKYSASRPLRTGGKLFCLRLVSAGVGMAEQATPNLWAGSYGIAWWSTQARQTWIG